MLQIRARFLGEIGTHSEDQVSVVTRLGQRRNEMNDPRELVSVTKCQNGVVLAPVVAI